jgi:hypothetical protein
MIKVIFKSLIKRVHGVEGQYSSVPPSMLTMRLIMLEQKTRSIILSKRQGCKDTFREGSHLSSRFLEEPRIEAPPIARDDWQWE